MTPEDIARVERVQALLASKDPEDHQKAEDLMLWMGHKLAGHIKRTKRHIRNSVDIIDLDEGRHHDEF